MKNKFYILICCLLALLYLPSGAVATQPTIRSDNETFSFGIHIDSFRDIDINEARVALDFWVDEMGAYLNLNLTTKIYYSLMDMKKDMSDGVLDAATMDPFHYWELFRNMSDDTMVAIVYNGKPTHKYYLLVRNNANFNSIRALKGRSVAYDNGDILIRFFLKQELARIGSKGYPRQYLIRQNAEYSGEKAVLDVFFKRVDACVVTDTVYGVMADMNPQITFKLKILSESDEIINHFCFIRRGMPPEIINNFKKSIREFRKTKQGREVLSLFRVDDVALVHPEDLNSLKDLLPQDKN